MDVFLEKLMNADWPILLGMAAMLWVFKNNQEKKFDEVKGLIDKLDVKLSGDIKELDEKLNNKIDNLEVKLNNKIDNLEVKLNDKIDKLDEKLSVKIDKLDEKLMDADRRLCRLEGAFASKDCCVIKESSNRKIVE